MSEYLCKFVGARIVGKVVQKWYKLVQARTPCQLRRISCCRNLLLRLTIVPSEFAVFYGVVAKINQKIKVGQKLYKLVRKLYKLVHQLETNVPTLVMSTTICYNMKVELSLLTEIESDLFFLAKLIL